MAADPTRVYRLDTRPAFGLIGYVSSLASALQVDNAIFFSALITVAAFVPLFTMQGVEGLIFQSHGADLRARAFLRLGH